MVVPVLLVGLALAGTGGQGGAAGSAADKLTLHDGSVVLGLVTATTTGPRGSVEVLVRRGWAEKFQPKHLRDWDRTSAAASREAAAERKRRLEAWRRERVAGGAEGQGAGAVAEDRILQWIDRELARLAAPGGKASSFLLAARLPRGDVHGLARGPAGVERIASSRLAVRLPEPETTPLDRLKDHLEGRGYSVAAIRNDPPASLESLLPLSPQPEFKWLARRAATEVTVDSGLRFIRFQDTVMPDAGPGQDLGSVGLSTAVSEIKRLLDVDRGPKVNPLEEKLNALAGRGRAGAVVTQLEIQPDLSSVGVESTLWARGPGNRWVPVGFRSATVRPEDLARDAGRDLAEDPQVKGAFKVVEMLGLGAVSPEIKDRSLKIGAATEKALGMARTSFNQYLDLLALPVLAPAPAQPARDQERGERKPR